MSFPRAKIQRFNETQVYTPSPADYNVALKSHVAGAVIPKSERFSEHASPAHSDNSSFVSSNGKPTFRTPNPPRRIKRQTSTDRKPHAVELFQSADDIEALKEKIVECNNKDLYIQELTEQLEEMKQQLSDLESQISHLNNDKTRLEENYEKLNENHEKSLKDLQTDYQYQRDKFNEQLTEVNEKMEQMKIDYVKLKLENQKDLAEVSKNIATLEEHHDAVTKSYQNLLEQKTKEVGIKEVQITQLEEEFVILQKNHQQEMEFTQNKHQEEVENIEYEMLKTVTEMQQQLEKEKEAHEKFFKEYLAQQDTKFNNYQAQFEQEKLNIQHDYEAKIKQLTENFKETSLLAEMQMKEKCSDIEMGWTIKLEEAKQESDAILKECQAIAEYNIIQCEVEKNKALYELSEQEKNVSLLKAENNQIKFDYHKAEEKYESLQLELNDIIAELNSTRTELQAYKNSVEQLTKEKHTYEITILKTHKTVEALKRRLMRSDQDVEQLKAELEATEESKLEFEGKCNQLTDELQIVCGLCDDMEEQNEMALRVAEEKVASLEHLLLQKVENYKEQANVEVHSISKELEKTKKELSDALEHVHEQQKMNIEAHNLITKSREEIEHLESFNTANKNKINNLEAAFDNLQAELLSIRTKELTVTKTNECLKDENKKFQIVIDLMQSKENNLIAQISELKEKCDNYEEYKNKAVEQENVVNGIGEIQKKYDELLEKYYDIVQRLEESEEENKILEKKVAEQESLIGPFREHLKAYEMEYNALISQKQNAEKEAQEMGLKYAEILGHQNQKQKIKHLIDLKKKNFELSENNRQLECKLRTQARTIDKLKNELHIATKTPRKLPKTEDKENVSSPNRTLNSSRVDSPSGPLRDRN